MSLDSDEMRVKISSIFSIVHISAQDSSDQMLVELKRHNYITPTHFLELVKGYRLILMEKRAELGNARDKLANGLAKLVEARDGVQVMSVELEKKKVVCAQSQKDCENLLVEIVSERRVADEQRKQVEADSERIGPSQSVCIVAEGSHPPIPPVPPPACATDRVPFCGTLQGSDSFLSAREFR